MSASDPRPLPTRSSTIAWVQGLVLAILVLAVGGFYFFGLHEQITFAAIREQRESLRVFVDDHFWFAAGTFFLVYTAVTALSLPIASILTLLAGALFDRLVGTGVTLLAATFGATLAFWSSRFLLGDWVQTRLGNRLDAFNRGIERDGAFYLFSLRLVPLFPFFLINLGMGLTPIRTWTFFWVSLIGMLPGTFLIINVGTTLSTLESTDDLLSIELIAALVLLGVAPLVFRKGMQWWNARRSAEY